MPPSYAPRELPRAIGRYDTVRAIGVGAMGRVLLARDPVLERHVAIKLLRDDLAIASDVREALLVRMRHEARAAARVTHPNLVVIHDMGEDDALGLYLVFEYIEGPTLKQRIKEGRLSGRQAARIAREIGAALTHAHEHGVLHRDVKPENIILSPTGSKLTDFGIARVPDSTLTHAGGLLGTPAYSAPETFKDGKFSPASDQFSLAATLYEAIRGARAFPGDDALSVASRITNEPPEPFAASLRYPGALDAILGRGLAKDPDARFESCKQLGASVQEALLMRVSRAPTDASAITEDPTLPPPPNPSVPPPTDRRGLRWFAVGLGGLLAAGVGARALLRAADDPSPGTATSASTSASAPQASSSALDVGSASAAPVKSPKKPTARPTPPPPAPPPEPEPPPPSSGSAVPTAAPPAGSGPPPSAP